MARLCPPLSYSSDIKPRDRNCAGVGNLNRALVLVLDRDEKATPLTFPFFLSYSSYPTPHHKNRFSVSGDLALTSRNVFHIRRRCAFKINPPSLWINRCRHCEVTGYFVGCVTNCKVSRHHTFCRSVNSVMFSPLSEAAAPLSPESFLPRACQRVHVQFITWCTSDVSDVRSTTR